MKAEKTCSVIDIEVYNTEAICNCINCLMSISNIIIEDALKYELPLVRTSLFDENRGMRLIFHDGGRYHIETIPLICGEWFLYDNGLQHERVKQAKV